MTARRALDAIRVGDRHRRDLGDIDALGESIRAVGLLQPVVVRPDGTLIAGERRLQAAKRLGWSDVPVHVVDIDAIVRGELAENTLRKNFTPTEMVAIAATVEEEERKLAKQRQLAALKRGNEKPVVENFHHGKARDKIAAPLGISGRTLEKARAVVQAAAAEPERFAPILRYMDESGRVDRAFKQIKIERLKDDHAKRTAAGCTVDDLVTLADSGKRFAVVYADPAWVWMQGETGKIHSSPDNFYTTEGVDQIAQLPVAPLAERDCVLLMWCTWPHVAIGSHVKIMEAWGFRPSTAAFIWVKTNHNDENLFTGQGYYTRSNSEVCFLATRGSPTRLTADVHQIVAAPVGEHSAKPEEVRRRIERLFPGPYLELYGRRPATGWTVWGNEIARDDMSIAEAAK